MIKGTSERIDHGFSPGDSFTVPANESMRQKCLMTYLNNLRNDLTRCEIHANWTVDHVVAFAMQVVTCLTTQRIEYYNKQAVWMDEKLIIVSISRCMQLY